MPPPLHLSAGGCSVLDVSGVPSGLLPGTTYEMLTIDLNPGDSVLFYTDGLMDASDPEDAPFGAGRLEDLARLSASVNRRQRSLGGIFVRRKIRVRSRTILARRHGGGALSTIPADRQAGSVMICRANLCILKRCGDGKAEAKMRAEAIDLRRRRFALAARWRRMRKPSRQIR